ncbi:MAG TPA: glycosyltransferase family 39 protein, partial [Caulobacteraceae bacterium]
MAESPIDRALSGGWRGPLLAAAVALLAALPGLIAMPVLDRDEARFAQSTAQMLETGDFVSINFQDAPRFKKPVGIHWLQALSVAAASSVEKRGIWAYRIPSLLGAMAAAAACAWGAAAFFGSTGGAVAGALLGASLILSTEGFIAKTDAALCAAVTLMMAALARIYAASKDEAVAGAGTRALFWAGMAVSILLKGPIGPMVAFLALLSLWAWDRKAAWMSGLGWTWGVALILLVVGPWAWAITVTTDGGFWTGAVVGDMLSKIGSGQESHGAPPGLHAVLAPLLLFPGTVLLPAALVLGWKARAETGV